VAGRRIGHVALLVRDYDEAIAWFTSRLKFEVIEDIDMGGGKRWVLVSPAGKDGTGTEGTSLLLAKAATPDQARSVGHQSGGRVFLFLHTDDFTRDHEHMKRLGVIFLEEPRHEPYGTVAVFQDLHGNKWDLLEPRRS
jgi:catechol 2,3-dioxygenase-like lactoylglutathione lyase family enzyme